MDVVTLGETMVRFSPPLGESLESAPVLHADPGGAESNVAVALARLGLSVGWISRLPETIIGRRIAGQIRRHGVDTSRVIWAHGERMGTYYIEPGRTPRPTTVVYDRADSAFSCIQPDEVDWSYVRQAGWLHLTGITPALGAGPARVIQRAMQEAGAADVTVSFDVNYRAKLWTPQEASESIAPFVEQATIVQCGVRDAHVLFDTPTEGAAAARALYERFRPRLIVVTAGEDGAFAYDGSGYHAPCIPVETLDPIGSGDAFAAGFIAGYREASIERGLAWGNALAALKRTYRGDLVWAAREDVRTVLEYSEQDIIR